MSADARRDEIDRRFAATQGCLTADGCWPKNLLAALKNGTPFEARLASFTAAGTWFEVDFAVIGTRQVFVREICGIADNNGYIRDAPVGHTATLQCVPDPARPGKYKFIVLEATDAAR